MAQKFRSTKTVEAVQWTGENLAEMCSFVGYEVGIGLSDRSLVSLDSSLIMARCGDWVVADQPLRFVTIPDDGFKTRFEAV